MTVSLPVRLALWAVRLALVLWLVPGTMPKLLAVTLLILAPFLRTALKRIVRSKLGELNDGNNAPGASRAA